MNIISSGMANVLFTHSYIYRLDEKQWRFKQPYPPLATIQAAAVARENGFGVTIFDTCLEKSTEKIISHLQQDRPKYVVIYDDSFNYLTKMCLTVMRQVAFDIAKSAKKFGCTVIISSSDSADHYEKYFLNAVDYVIRGEGEITLVELLKALENRVDPGEVKGLAFRKLGQTVVTESRPVVKNLDSYPIPAWDLIDVDSYRKVWKKHHGYFSLNIATTRGCPFKCNWCAKPIYGNRYNSRSPEHVVNEIEDLVKKYQPDHFWICDDIFGLKPGWVAEFSSLLQSRGLRIRFKIQSRADLLLEEETVNALAEAGAETVWLGAESGAQKILDAMDKGTTVQQIEDATRLLKSKNIEVAFFLQFGYPGEEAADINSTISLVLKLMPDQIGISVSYPLPGTKFYENVKSQLGEKTNWSDSDDLDMMFTSTYPREYYRELHKYVHAVYRKNKGTQVLQKLLSKPLRLTRKDVRNGLASLYYIPSTLSVGIKLKKLEKANLR